MKCIRCGKPHFVLANDSRTPVCKDCYPMMKECPICKRVFFPLFEGDDKCNACYHGDDWCECCMGTRTDLKVYIGTLMCPNCLKDRKDSSMAKYFNHQLTGEFNTSHNMVKDKVLNNTQRHFLQLLGLSDKYSWSTGFFFDQVGLHAFQVECECCQEVYVPRILGKYTFINQQYFCPECAEHLVGCTNCSKVLDKRIDVVEEVGTEFYCPECFSQLSYCDDCGDTILLGDEVYLELSDSTTTVCSSCADEYSRCDDCRKYFPTNDMNRDRSICVCNSCYEDSYYACEDCGDICSLDSSCYDEYNDRTLCSSCYNSVMASIMDDEPRIEVQTLRDNDHPFAIGMELEFECAGNRQEICQEVKRNYYPFLWCKSDGSLSHDNGLETPCQPMTWEYWLEKGKDELETYISFLNRRNCRAWRTSAGIHISLDRDGFSTGHLYKFLKFFYENPEYIFRISRRNQSSFEKWCDCKSLNRKGLAQKFKERQHGGDKYEAVNLNHSSHIEIRIFAGTLNWDSILANIEFCRGVYEYTDNEGMKDVSVMNFENYMIENKDSFPNFYKLFHPVYQHPLPIQDNTLKIRKSSKRITL